MNVNELLDTIEDTLEESAGMPLSGGKRIVDVEQIRDYLDEIRANLPVELRQAQSIVSDRAQLIESANAQAQAIVKKAEERARILVSEAEIVRAAQQRASEIVSAAQTEARTVRQTVTDYCENMLRTTEDTMVENAAQVKNIRNSLRQPQQFQTQICALLRAAARGPLRVMFPMVTEVEDWDAAMSIVEHCRQSLRERGVPFNENTQFGVMLSIPAACLTVEDFVAHGCDFLVIGTNDLTQYTHAADRELASAEHYYRPASKAMKKLIRMVMDAAKQGNVPVTICGLAVGNPANATQYLQLGLRSFSVSPQNLIEVKKALMNAKIK